MTTEAAKISWFSRKSVTLAIQTLLTYLILIILALLWVFPLFWLVSSSLKVNTQLMVFPPIWIPDPINWQNYTDAVKTFPFFSYLLNSLMIGGLAALGAVIVNPMIAYGFSRIQWPGRDIIFVISLATMMLPFAVTMIPVYIIFTQLNLVGSWAPLIAPSYLGRAFYIFLIRQFFLGIPKDLSDSARIDGASEFQIFLMIIVPLARPILASVALLEFMDRWRDFLGPLIYLTDGDLYPISLGLQYYISAHNVQWALLMAASTMVTIPPLIAFLFTQKTFIEGVTFTGIKG